MDPIAVQLVVLAAAYVVALLVAGGAIVSSVISFRSSRRIEVRAAITSRVTSLENELASFRDVVDTFSKRWNKRTQDEKRATKRSESGDPEDQPQGNLTADDLVRIYKANRGE